jgi:hypothetical protein
VADTLLFRLPTGTYNSFPRVQYKVSTFRHAQPPSSSTTNIDPLPNSLHAISWLPAIIQLSLHLGPPQPRRTTILPGAICIHGAVPALGPTRLFIAAPQHTPER